MRVLCAGCEVAVFEGAMHKLQSDMQAKRREAYKLEDQTGLDNPPVFATVQVGIERHGPLFLLRELGYLVQQQQVSLVLSQERTCTSCCNDLCPAPRCCFASHADCQPCAA